MFSFHVFGSIFSVSVRNFPEPPTRSIFSKVSPVEMGGAMRYK